MTDSLATQTFDVPSASSTPTVLVTRELGKRVDVHNGSLTILKGVDLEVNQGESLAIIGASGSGKSTLLGLLAGLDNSSEGEVWLAGTEISTLDEDERAQVRNQTVGFVFQNFQLLPALTALENVMLPMELNGQANAEAEAVTLLKSVGLGDHLNQYPRHLSGGEQQRVAIARAFACKPSILFADEPTGNLDRKTGEQIIELLFNLNRESDTTLILVTHDNQLAQRCQRCLELVDGKLVQAQHS